MADTFKNVAMRDNPGDDWFLITPGATELAIRPRHVLCVATGNITMENAAGVSITLTGVAANTTLRMRPFKVTAATGTFWGLY